MSTLSFHADEKLEQRIRAEARQRRMSVSRLLAEAVGNALPEHALRGEDLFGSIRGAGTVDPHEEVLPSWNEKLTGAE